MKIFISRVSTEEQSELRQIQNVEGFDKVIIDKMVISDCGIDLRHLNIKSM